MDTRTVSIERSSRPRSRRVLIIVENLPVPFDRRVWNIARTLQGANYTVSVICPKGKGQDASYACIEGIHIYRHRLPVEARGAWGYLAEYGTALASEFWLAWKVLFRHGFDTVHICNPPDLLFLVGGLFKLLGKKLVFDHHDICPELYEAKFGRRDVFWRLMVQLEKWTFQAADISIATNESYREIAETRGNKAPEQVFVVRSGPDLSRLRLRPATPRHRQGRRFLVGYVGVMGAQEGLGDLLHMIKSIVQQGRHDIHFALIGSGTELESLKAQAEVLNIAAYVTFTGRVSDADLLDILNTADICVNPDSYNTLNDKSTMNKIMEYMALAKPIVQYDMTEGRFSARDASLYARPGDRMDFASKILELLDDPERRARMGAAGRSRVDTELAWPHEAPKLLAAYESLYATAAAPAGTRMQTP